MESARVFGDRLTWPEYWYGRGEQHSALPTVACIGWTTEASNSSG